MYLGQTCDKSLTFVCFTCLTVINLDSCYQLFTLTLFPITMKIMTIFERHTSARFYYTCQGVKVKVDLSAIEDRVR